ncbi:MAG TPA: 2-oxoglutarate dehydrogenase complex dihydrolipoyllysine-residue succinyltransferase [Candidatus Binatia bacterium]|nr:2-oxoglutarate dehydrogenase complex dihydrolipoyllysine-residue succinyltransferase [Candidatus Binatia bacterium]
MAFEVRIPTLGESVTEGTITRWRKAEGEAVAPDEVLLELETDKANMEIPAERGGVLHIVKPEGATVQVGEVVATLDEAAARPAAPRPAPARPEPAAAAPPSEPARAPEAPRPAPPAGGGPPLSPAVRHLVAEHRLEPERIPATGKGGRLTKADVVEHLARARPGAAAPEAEPPAPRPQAAAPRASVAGDGEEPVPMSRLRRRIAERLVQAQRTAAILTTFNEIDMSAVIDLRARHRERFQRAHDVSLGFMSFFAHACIAALREFPAINAEIRGDDIVYKHFVHLGIAVGTERGLVVPVVHHADRMSFAEIEREIARLAALARDGKLSVDDLAGGTFTISNGGVYGSLLSTPILNPPQSGILGMHKIERRPVVVDDEVVIRPMMYVALSYDHRIVDGEQAVTFLVRVKERIEDPARMLLDV